MITNYWRRTITRRKGDSLHVTRETEEFDSYAAAVNGLPYLKTGLKHEAVIEAIVIERIKN